MTKEEIFYKHYDVRYYQLSTRTIKTDKGIITKGITTDYYVEWHTSRGTLNQEISKEEYEVLLKELEKENEK